MNGTTALRALLALYHKVGTINTYHLFNTNDMFHSPCLYLTRGSHAKLRKLCWYPQIGKMSWYPQIGKNVLVPPDWKNVLVPPDWKKCPGTPRLEKCPGTPRLEKMSWYPPANKLLQKCVIFNKAINLDSRGLTEQYSYVWEPHRGCCL